MESVVTVTQRGRRSQRPIDVHVARARHGGWDVIATQDGHILASQHCDDWHRAERVYQRMSAAARLELPLAV